MMQFLINLLSTLPIITALLAVAAVNAKRDVRVRQTPMPFIAAIYLVVALVVFYKFNETFDSIIQKVTELVPFFPRGQGQAWFYFSENVIVISFFIILKILAKPLLSRLFSEGRGFLQTALERLYEYDPESNLWFVEKRISNVRILLRVLYWSSIALVILLLTLVRQYPNWPGFESVAFPALAVLVVGELYFALDGLTRKEHEQEILGEKDSANRKGNYGPLRKILADVFPSRVMTDGVHLKSAAALDSGHRLGQLSLSQSDEENLAGAYFKRLKENREPVNVNLVEATVDLLKGSSVLINNPFYVDLTPYLALPMYYNLLKYRKCLIIAGRDDSAEDLTNWMVSGLESVTGIPDLWNVQILSPMGKDSVDVGVLRFGDVHNLELLSNNDEFFQNVEYVILAEPSRMMATGQLGLGLLLSRCAKGEVPTYAAFDSNHDGLVDALSHLLKLSLSEVVASALPEGASSEVIWRAEGPHMQAEIMPSISRYLGVGTEIAAVAMKYQVSKVHWVGSEKFPVNDMVLIAGQYYSQINKFADIELSQDAFNASLIPTHNPWKLKQDNNYFLVVEDETSNAFEAIRIFATRAKDNGFINLISEDYLLRDYMISNRDLFSLDQKAVPSIVADFARTERNAVLRMIMALVTYEMSSTELEHEFEVIGRPITQIDPAFQADGGWESPVVVELRAAIQEHTGVTEVPIKSFKLRELNPEDSEGIQELYSIESGSELDQVIDSLKAAYFFVEDEVEDVNRIGSLLFGHVYQSILPGQFLTHGGKYYQVQGISTTALRNGVILRRAAEHINDRRAYRQLRRFRLSDVRIQDGVGSVINVGPIQLIHSSAHIQVESLGYLESPSRSAINQGRKVTISDLPPRDYVNKAILEIKLPEVTADVRKAITLMFNELFVTVFPHNHQYVSALTTDLSGDFGDLLDEIQFDDIYINSDAENSIFIVEDSMVDLGLIVSVERYWERFMNTITDYLEWNLSVEPDKEVPLEAAFVPVFREREPKESRGWWKRLWDKVTFRKRRQRKRSQKGKRPIPSVTEVSVGADAVNEVVAAVEFVEHAEASAASQVKVESVDVESVDVESVDVESVDVESVDVESVDVESVDVESVDVEGAQASPETKTATSENPLIDHDEGEIADEQK